MAELDIRQKAARIAALWRERRQTDALPAERTATRWIVSTDPEEHVQQIRFYTDLGFNHLVFHAPGPDQRRFLNLYAERVMPLLRKVVVTA